MQTIGRRVRVQSSAADVICQLKGHRVVIGDRVHWESMSGGGGRITKVLERTTALRRVDIRGKEQVLAANLSGLLLVQSVVTPGFRVALLDRIWVSAAVEGLEVALVLNKTDLGVSDAVKKQLTLRVAQGLQVFYTSVQSNDGIDALQDFLSSTHGPWAVVGGSGVGKTSLIAALLPQQDVGPIGAVSEAWGSGRHTTTSSTLFSLPKGGELADSPGIRNFTPAGLSPARIGAFFPGFFGLPCLYRDCKHRPDEEGCVAEDRVDPSLIKSYRRLLQDLNKVEDSQKRWKKTH